MDTFNVVIIASLREKKTSSPLSDEMWYEDIVRQIVDKENLNATYISTKQMFDQFPYFMKDDRQYLFLVGPEVSETGEDYIRKELKTSRINQERIKPILELAGGEGSVIEKIESWGKGLLEKASPGAVERES